MSPRLASVLLVFAIACGGGQQKPPPAPPSNDTLVEPTPAPPPTQPSSHPDPAPRADGRPAVVTDELMGLVEELTLAMEKMGADATAAGSDCIQGAAAIRNAVTVIRPVALRAKAFEESMKDPAAEEWFKQHYMDRIVKAMTPLMSLAQTCSSDQEFMAAMNEMGESFDGM